MIRYQFAIVAIALLFGGSISAAAEETVELFNGSDLAGWTKRGGAATYAVEDGVIVGRSAPNTSNTFLCTDRDFGDFELELDFKIDDTAFNSGIQIRSHSRPERGGQRVYGYQVEIDPQADRAWTAGIYFEGGSEHRDAGWLNDLTDNEAARKAFRLGEWNHVRVVAVGRHIQTWLNGVPAADYTDTDDDAFTPTGFIALQVHSVGAAEDPKEVRWKNLKLTVVKGEASGADGEQDSTASQPDSSSSEAPNALRVFGRIVGAMFGIDTSGRQEGDEFLHLLGQPAPKFQLTDTAGETVRLDDLQGQVVLLDFWASWCGPCRAAMPELEKVYAEFGDKPVVVLGVNQGDDRDAALDIINQQGVTFRQLLDTDSSVGDAYGANAIPHTVLLDRQGNIQWIHQGYSPNMATTLAENIRKLLRGESLFDAEKVAEARARRAQRQAELAEQIGIEHPERLEQVTTVLAGPTQPRSTYSPAQWVTLAKDRGRALAVLSNNKKLILISADSHEARTIDFQWGDEVGMWDYCPALVGDELRWAGVGAEYDDRYRIKQYTVSLFGDDGMPLWSNVYAALPDDSRPQIDLAAGDLTGDGNAEVALLVQHDGLEKAGVSGPDGATRVLTVYDCNGTKLLRTWVPGPGGAAVFTLPDADGDRMLMATGEGLITFRVRLNAPSNQSVASTTATGAVPSGSAPESE